jgi:hypothetical protein
VSSDECSFCDEHHRLFEGPQEAGKGSADGEHVSMRTTQLYDWCTKEVTPNEAERILVWSNRHEALCLDLSWEIWHVPSISMGRLDLVDFRFELIGHDLPTYK